jgi:hypothetical protein
VISDPAVVTDSGMAAPKASRKAALLDAADVAQKALAVAPAVPLHERPVVSYAEAAALGISPERTLRRLVAIGRVKRAVIRSGRRVRFIVRDLLDELRQVQE